MAVSEQRLRRQLQAQRIKPHQTIIAHPYPYTWHAGCNTPRKRCWSLAPAGSQIKLGKQLQVGHAFVPPWHASCNTPRKRCMVGSRPIAAGRPPHADAHECCRHQTISACDGRLGASIAKTIAGPTHQTTSNQMSAYALPSRSNACEDNCRPNASNHIKPL